MVNGVSDNYMQGVQLIGSGESKEQSITAARLYELIGRHKSLIMWYLVVNPPCSHHNEADGKVNVEILSM